MGQGVRTEVPEAEANKRQRGRTKAEDGETLSRYPKRRKKNMKPHIHNSGSWCPCCDKEKQRRTRTGKEMMEMMEMMGR